MPKKVKTPGSAFEDLIRKLGAQNHYEHNDTEEEMAKLGSALSPYVWLHRNEILEKDFSWLKREKMEVMGYNISDLYCKVDNEDQRRACGNVLLLLFYHFSDEDFKRRSMKKWKKLQGQIPEEDKVDTSNSQRSLMSLGKQGAKKRAHKLGGKRGVDDIITEILEENKGTIEGTKEDPSKIADLATSIHRDKGEELQEAAKGFLNKLKNNESQNE